MAAVIPSVEPITFAAGDTASWTKTLPDYPATESWVLSYAFRFQNGSGKTDVTATTPASPDYAVTLLATTTAQMKAGTWSWAAYVTKGAERHQVGAGSCVVTPNLAVLDMSVDLRSDAKQALDQAMAAWKTVQRGQSVMLNGRTYTQQNIKDLIIWVDRCKSDYQLELDAQTQASKSGLNPRHIGVRFGDA